MTQYPIQGRTSSEIAASVEAAVLTGELTAGQTLPTIRALAGTCGVSPATTAAAYRRLRERGIAISDGRRGTRIAPVHRASFRQLRDRRSAERAPAIASHGDTRLVPGLRDLANGNPDPALLPDLSEVTAKLTGPKVLYGAERDVEELVARAHDAFVADKVDAAAMTVVSGALDGVERVMMAELRPGDAVAIEDPGYSAAIDLVKALGLIPVGCALDDEGMLPEPLAGALERGAKCVLLTPRAQNPSGAATSAARAAELGEVLAQFPNALVIEDDHAGPIAGAPLQLSCAGHERWAVIRSVSKWLGPDLRVAVLAGNPTIVARVERRQALGQGWVSRLLQSAAAALWELAASGRPSLLDEATSAYSARRSALLAALSEMGVSATGRSGLNVWIPVAEETAVCERLAAGGWGVRAGERYRLRSGPAVRVTVSSLAESEAPQLAAAIAAAVHDERRTIHWA